MAETLSWNLHGNDGLSGILEKLDRTVEKLSRQLDRLTSDAVQAGQGLEHVEDGAEDASRGLDHMAGRTDVAGDRLDRLGRRAGDMSGKVSTAMTAVAAVTAVSLGAVLVLLAGVTLAFGAAAGAAGYFGLKTAAANETAAISFEVLLGSEVKALAYLKELQEFAANTPFDMPDLRDAASRLIAVGVETEKIIPLLTRLGDATAAMGTGADGIDRAVYALQQMTQAGKVSLEDINQLTDAGIPALDALAAHLDTTVAKLREEISAGKIKPDDLFQAILDGAGKTFPKLNGMMQRQSATLSGMWSAFKDRANQSLATFAEPMIPGAKKVLDWLESAFPRGLDVLTKMGSDIDEIFDDSPVKGELMTGLRALSDRVLPALRQGWSDLTIYVENNRDKFERIGRWIAEVGIPLFGEGLVGGIKLTVNAFMTVVDVMDVLVSAFVGGSITMITVLGDILDAAVWAFGWIPELGPKLKQSQTDFDKWAAEIIATLNRIDGKDVGVDLWIRTHGMGVWGEHSGPGVVIDSDRDSRPPARGKGKGFGAPAGFAGADRGPAEQWPTGGEEVIGVLKVVHVTPGGAVIREELLQLKRRRGMPSLGLG